MSLSKKPNSKYLIAPFRLADNKSEIRYEGRWHHKIGDDYIGTAGVDDPIMYTDIDIDQNVGFRFDDLSEKEMRRIDEYYKPIYGD